MESIQKWFSILLFYIIVFIHGIINMILFFAPYFVENIFWFRVLLIFYFVYLLLRYNIGYCIITWIEHWINPKVVPTIHKSYFRLLLSEYIGNTNSKQIFFIVPIIGMIYTFIQVYMHEYNNTCMHPTPTPI